MTKTDIEALKAELIRELESINEIRVLKSVKSVLTGFQAQKFAKTQCMTGAVKPTERERVQEQEQPPIQVPCCYTIEELKSRITDSYNSFEQGEFFIDEDSINTKLRIKISLTKYADNDLRDMIQYTDLTYPNPYLFTSQLENLIEMLNYNTKSGKKDFLFADILDNKVRSISINKNCILYYIEVPEGILILALQNSKTPIDIRLHHIKKSGNKRLRL